LGRMGLPVVESARFLGLAATVGTVILCPLIARRLGTQAVFFTVLPAALLAVSGPLAAWALGGMETALFTFLVAAALHLAVREAQEPQRRPWSAAMFALATLTRPEGLAVFAGAATHRFVTARRGTQKPWPARLSPAKRGRGEGGEESLAVSGLESPETAPWRDARGRGAVWGAIFVVIVGAHLAFRYGYYGYLLPNTFYAKIGGASPELWLRGLKYVHHYASTYYGLAVLLLPLLLLALRRRSDPEILLLCAAGAYLAAVILEGGDYMTAFRFMVPALPMLFVLTSRTLELLVTRLQLDALARRPAQGLGLALVFVALGSSLLLDARYDEEIEAALRLKEERRQMGQWLRANRPPNTLMAANAIGVLAYYAGLPTLDMYGLTDAHIAHQRPVKPMGQDLAGHEKWDPEYVLSRRPDIVILGVGRLTDRPIRSMKDLQMDRLLQFEPGDYGIWFHRDFQRGYEPVNVRLRAGNFCFFQRKEAAPRED
jgi:arabinofuranosyltransferase